jgi:16S rRNA (cytosine1402-N4)-methyltransferase
MTTHTLTPVRVKTHSRREEAGFRHEQKSEAEVLQHTSVMPSEVLEYLAPQNGDVVLDATAGAGGHSELLLSSNAKIKLIALDADARAVAAVQKRLEKFSARAQVFESNFADCGSALTKAGVTKINKALFDLGWNRTQLASGRGFSFLRDEPLNMSYGKKPASGFTAGDIVNNWSEETLANVLYGYGEERYARRIAKNIVEARELQPIDTTFQLVELIKKSVPAAYRNGRLHFATRSFQALRIAANDELGVLERGLASAWKHLAIGGRIAVITFHSIEDRVVKRLFAGLVKEEEGRLVLKKPLAARKAEIITNPPSRSAKLRVIEKI